ncbi:MAG: hypothetical protein ACKOAU_18245, partial [Pirellula sp.]
MADASQRKLNWLRWRTTLIAILALVCIATYLGSCFTGFSEHPWPLWVALGVGGLPLILELLGK